MTVPTPAAAGWVNGAPLPVPAQAERGAGTGQIARLVGIDFARFLAGWRR